MTTYHLNFWSKTNGQGLSQIERVYVNGPDRSTLGYFEMRIGMMPRSSDSYYDRHRIAKGDMIAETGRTYNTTLSSEHVAAIYEAPAIAAYLEASKGSDDFSRFSALRAHARGLNVVPYHPAKSAVGRAERKAIKERQTFSIEL